MTDRQTEQVTPANTIYTKYVKRMLDVVLSSLALLVLSPFFALVTLGVLFCNGYPIFYTTQRPGRYGKLFVLRKFRSMTYEKGKDGKLLPESRRLTAFGRFIRKTSLDELPELLSIIKGDMSIIGPRPLMVEYLPLYSPRHQMRHAVRPGLECAPIRKGGLIDTWGDQFENDILYVENISFCLDVKLLFKTVWLVFDRNSTMRRANDNRQQFDGTNLYSTATKGEIESGV